MIAKVNCCLSRRYATDEMLNRILPHRIPLVVVLVAHTLRRTAG
jgi:hypothetical protein